MDIRERNYLSQIATFHRPLMLVVAAMAVTTLISAAGVAVDDRMLLGVPIWEKPLKFSISFVLYGGVLAALIPMLRAGRRLAHRMGTVMAAMWVLEMVIVISQVIRGRSSHFNNATAFDATLFSIMGLSIVIFWVANLVIAVLLWRHHFADRALGWAVRLSVLVALAGAALGFLMTTRSQDAAADMTGAHSVGVTDGGPVMPILGWSTTGGDLRIAHFVGMHALQVLPLIAFGLAWWAGRQPRLADTATRIRLVLIAAAGYTGLTGLTLWQALRGEPLIYPSGTTIGVAVALVVAVAGAAIATIRMAPEPRAAELETTVDDLARSSRQ